MDIFRDIDGPQHSDLLRSKLIEGVLELNAVKKSHSDSQRKLLQNEHKISEIQATNKSLKQSLVLALTTKEQALARSDALAIIIEKLTQQIDEYKQETDSLLEMYQRSFKLE